MSNFDESGETGTEAEPDLKEALAQAFSELQASPARETRLIIEAGEVYLVYAKEAKEKVVLVEAVNSERLPAHLKLSSARAMRLRQAGFKKPGGGLNWMRKQRIEPDFSEIAAAEATAILGEVYAVEEELTVTLVRDEREHPENKDLVDAMRVVSRGFDEGTRRAMYNEMVNAVYLVPVDENAPGEADLVEALAVLEENDKGPVLGVFTDWASLRAQHPKGHAYAPLHGSELFELALEKEVSGMRFNPGGRIGGELYRHEVEMLAEAVRRFRRRHSN